MSSSEKHLQPIQPRGSALIPFLVFIIVYLGAGIILQITGMEMAFYQVPAPIAVIVGIIVAFIMFKGTIDHKFDQFLAGCGDSNIMTMCCIYLLAGGFAAVAKAMGGVESTANLGLSIIPAQYITAGMFVIAAFLSLAAGTSVGTITAIGPIAVEVASKADLNMVLMMGAVVGGAMFGDNLSMISDTTIAATRTQGVAMRDKFRVNFLIALPASLITVVLLLLFGRPDNAVPLGELSYSVVNIIPYLWILVLSLSGLNVFVTLTSGILIALVIGIVSGELALLGSVKTIYDGFVGMFEIFLLSMLTGGLSEMVTQNGGLLWILQKIQSKVTGKRSAEIGIAGLVSMADMATANNTVAIVITGSIAKGISDQYHVDPRRSASLLDTWSCVFQGIVPYGAQVLIGCGLTAGLVNPFQLLTALWYPYLLGVFALLSIFVPFADGFIRKHPWNWQSGTSSDDVPIKESAADGLRV
ncbi:MAG: Na+/H+ antiporter NhaC family protein [Peptococcaceae bacterium]|jgi:Na+/H+ antiporter NhaC|nr:Na+/H+ antiporter NhaC family protein [Peptococcaceae bacterium]